jgi:hypothetical protein
MVRLLDNFMMPDDLPLIREDGTDDWVYALPGRKDDKQLFRLALANAEAEGELYSACVCCRGRDSRIDIRFVQILTCRSMADAEAEGESVQG